MPCESEGNEDVQNGPGCPPDAEPFLADVLAKSASHSGTGRPEPLTGHSRKTRDAARTVAARIGSPGVLAGYLRFWAWAEQAALLHDAGKIAAGFQLQLRQKQYPWRERHEILSLAYVDLLTAHMPGDDRAMIAAGVVFHHRCIDGRQGLAESYPHDDKDWERAFRLNPDAPPGYRAQVAPDRHAALLAWLAAEQGSPPPAPRKDLKLWQRAREQFAAVEARWSDPVPETDGLVAVLLQGAVTLADHSASADIQLDTGTPLPFGYLEKRVAAPYPHQRAAAGTDGHLILISPTGSGKTEGGLAWASRQMESMPGQPRLVWVLPYRASINAIRDRFAEDFGCGTDGIGVLHGTAAATLLDLIVCDDRAAGKEDARKARAMAGAMRLFRQRVRVATPHQLLRAAIAGPKYASVLLEQANSVLVLDELHAYDPVTFGRICAAMTLWEQLGSRVAVVSATLAPPMIKLIRESVAGSVTVHRAAPGTAPVRHRLILDDQPVTAPGNLERVREWLADGSSVLVVANKVRTAQQVFRDLAPDTGDAPGLLLHSRFKYRDRKVIEDEIMRRHPQREPGDPARRGGGLVVSTQALEVSLCLDFDRGVSEIAPVEAIAQRAGRVNRRGRHPDGPVEFRVHATDAARPYDEGAIGAAMLALRDWDGKLVSEQAIDDWLARAYDTPWGRDWAQAARDSREKFGEAFLRFRDPFHDRSEFARALEEQFDSVEVLLHCDVAQYLELASGDDGDPLKAAGLLIPVSLRQAAILGAKPDERLGVRVADPQWDACYTTRAGLDLTAGNERQAVMDTIL
jgi:CRISPR-associated endonuclease/helicase Cas3